MNLEIYLDWHPSFFTSLVLKPLIIDTDQWWKYTFGNIDIRHKAAKLPYIGPDRTLDKLYFPEVVILPNRKKILPLYGYIKNTKHYFILDTWLSGMLEELEGPVDPEIYFKKIVDLALEKKILLNVEYLKFCEYLLHEMNSKDFYKERTHA